MSEIPESGLRVREVWTHFMANSNGYEGLTWLRLSTFCASTAEALRRRTINSKTQISTVWVTVFDGSGIDADSTFSSRILNPSSSFAGACDILNLGYCYPASGCSPFELSPPSKHFIRCLFVERSHWSFWRLFKLASADTNQCNVRLLRTSEWSWASKCGSQTEV